MSRKTKKNIQKYSKEITVESIQSDKKYKLISKSINDQFDLYGIESIFSGYEFSSMNGAIEILPKYSPAYLDFLLKQSAVHQAAQGLKSTMLAGLGLNIPKDTPKEIKDFLDAPNNTLGQKFASIVAESGKDLERAGYFGWGIIKNSAGIRVFPVPYRAIRVFRKKDSIDIAYFKEIYPKYSVSATRVTLSSQLDTGRKFYPLKRDTVIRDNTYYLAYYREDRSDSIFYSEPSYISIEDHIKNNAKIRKYNDIFFDNNSTPSYTIFITGGGLTNDQKTAIQEKIKTNFKGLDNVNRGLFIHIPQDGATIELKKVDGVTELSFEDGYGLNNSMIATGNNVPPKAIGLSKGSALGAGSESNGALKILKETLKPKQQLLNNFINDILWKIFGKKTNITVKSLNLTNEKEMSVIYNVLASIKDADGRPVLKVNEIREELGREPHLKETFSADSTPEPNDKRNTITGVDTDEGQKNTESSTEVKKSIEDFKQFVIKTYHEVKGA